MLSFGPTGHQAIIRDLTNAALGLHQAAGLTLPPPYGAGKRLNVTRKLCVSNATAARLRETIKAQTAVKAAVANQQAAAEKQAIQKEKKEAMQKVLAESLEKNKQSAQQQAKLNQWAATIKEKEQALRSKKSLPPVERVPFSFYPQNPATLPTVAEATKAVLSGAQKAARGVMNRITQKNRRSAPATQYLTPAQIVAKTRNEMVRMASQPNSYVEQQLKNIGAIVDNEGRAVPSPQQFTTSPDDESLFARPQLSNRNRQAKSSSNAAGQQANLVSNLAKTSIFSEPPSISNASSNLDKLRRIRNMPLPEASTSNAAPQEKIVVSQQDEKKLYDLLTSYGRLVEQNNIKPTPVISQFITANLQAIFVKLNGIFKGKAKSNDLAVDTSNKKVKISEPLYNMLQGDFQTKILVASENENSPIEIVWSSTQSPPSSQPVSFSPLQSRRR